MVSRLDREGREIRKELTYSRRSFNLYSQVSRKASYGGVEDCEELCKGCERMKEL